jgi:hypothetical protein
MMGRIERVEKRDIGLPDILHRPRLAQFVPFKPTTESNKK